jgi:hypothetical protein
MVGFRFGADWIIIWLIDGLDAVPKKRGPKTDVLESLLKRVDGLEKRLKDEKQPGDPSSPKQESPEDLSGLGGNGEGGATPAPISLPTPTLELASNTSPTGNGISVKRSPTESTRYVELLQIIGKCWKYSSDGLQSNSTTLSRYFARHLLCQDPRETILYHR